jgi:hypothetical protein
MKHWLRSTMTALVAIGAQALACGSTTSSPSSSSYPTFNDAGEDANEPLSDAASVEANSTPEAAATQAFARLAAFAPDEVAVDFCVAPHGTTRYEGPLIAELAAREDAGIDDAEAGPFGLSFPEVSAYVALSPGSYDVTVVAAGAASCPGGRLELTSLRALAAGSYTTVAVLGDAETDASGHPFALVTFNDDTGASVPSGASLRFINAAPEPSAVDLGTGSLQNANFQALFTDVPFGGTGGQSDSDAGPVDARGYLAYSPITGAVLSVHASIGATTDTAVADGVDIGFGSVTTFILVGSKAGDAGPSEQLVQCSDGVAVGWLSACAFVSP